MKRSVVPGGPLSYTGVVPAELPREELRWRFLAPTRRT